MGWGNESTLVQLKRDAAKVHRLEAERDELRALVNRQLGECIGCNYNDGPDECCPQHGRTVTEWIDIASTVIGRQHAIEAERDAALARIAAVEAEHRPVVVQTINGNDTVCSTCGSPSAAVRYPCPTVAALAASPTPTGPERQTCSHGYSPHCYPMCVDPEPTEETPKHADPNLHVAERRRRILAEHDAAVGPGGADPKETRP